MKQFDDTIQKILLNETPIFIDKELSINLNDHLTNKLAVKNCLEEGEKLKDFENWKVYKIEKENFIYFCFIDKNNMMDAYAEFLIEKSEVNSKRVLQRKTETTKGLLRRVFLNYFPYFFSSIKLDKMANKLGKSFFEKLMKESIKNNFKVVVVNERTTKETPYKEENFEQYWDKIVYFDGQKVNPLDVTFKIYYR
jgi:hypothetical protein